MPRTLRTLRTVIKGPEMSQHFHYLRIQLDRAREHVVRCRDALERFDRHADPADIMADRARERLERHVREAEVSAGWAEVALADVSAPTEAA